MSRTSYRAKADENTDIVEKLKEMELATADNEQNFKLLFEFQSKKIAQNEIFNNTLQDILNRLSVVEEILFIDPNETEHNLQSVLTRLKTVEITHSGKYLCHYLSKYIFHLIWVTHVQEKIIFNF